MNNAFAQNNVAIKSGFAGGDNGVAALHAVIEICADQCRNVTLRLPFFYCGLKVHKDGFYALWIEMGRGLKHNREPLRREA